MTPMVDVVMVILVFFMVSAAFLGPEWLLGSLVPRPVTAAGSSNAAQVRAKAPRTPTRSQPHRSASRLTCT